MQAAGPAGEPGNALGLAWYLNPKPNKGIWMDSSAGWIHYLDAEQCLNKLLIS